ncbi:DUF1491 family protein [Kiloniella laminariae]|uniref:DUF1491 family protein n=1 Tax=Kiloniella laminariae TaxID=454162 RepID=UPI00036C95D8|nr:DUF1491 family protein [Kiloniella laminariae]
MDNADLSADLWIMAQVRQSNQRGIPAMILHKGDRDRGSLLLKINLLGPGCQILSQTRDLDGNLAWMAANKGALMSEPDADEYVARALKRDPDLWVVELEDRKGENPFGGTLL